LEFHGNEGSVSEFDLSTFTSTEVFTISDTREEGIEDPDSKI
jgi:hypothetical protein